MSGENDVERFNRDSDFKFIPFERYQNEPHFSPDLLMVGPTLNFDTERIQALVSNPKTPIMLMTEYDFPRENMEDRAHELSVAGYLNVAQMPTGLGPNNKGIFVEQSLVEFSPISQTELNAVFN